MIKPIAERTNLHPDYITILGFILALIAGYLFATKNLFFAAIVLGISGFLDMLDGAVARIKFRPTPFGEFLDSVMDRFSDAAIVLGITFGGFINWILGIFLLHSFFTISYVRAKSESIGVNCEIGIAERPERLIIIFIASILGEFVNLKIMTIFMIFLLLISYITVFQRIHHTWKAVKK